jgi:NAD(P)-dependent dehydrogenase (short-subunit alcohol dehydrogenase family)
VSFRLKDKVAIVTGTASGFGRGAAIMFAQEGARVVGGDIDVEGGGKVVDEIRSAGGESIFVATDVSQSGQVLRLIETAVTRYGGVDVLFSNVGLCIGNALVDVTEEEWDRIMAINLKSMFLCAKYAIPEMQKSGKGSIVLMSSANGIMAEPCLATYCATKSAIIGLVRSIATDYGKYNIRCNCVCPTYTRTPLLEKWMASGVDPNLTWEKLNRLHALNRISEVNEVVNCVLFLASDESSIITGSTMVIDGGLTTFKLE